MLTRAAASLSVLLAMLAVACLPAVARAEGADKNLERCMKDARCRAAYFRHKPYKKEDFADDKFDPQSRLDLTPEGRAPGRPEGDKAPSPRSEEARARAWLDEVAAEQAPPHAAADAIRIDLRGGRTDGRNVSGLEAALSSERRQFRVGFERNRTERLEPRTVSFLGVNVSGHELSDTWWFHAGFSGAPRALSARWSWLRLRTWVRAEVGFEVVFAQFRRANPPELLPAETRLHPYLGAGLGVDLGVPLAAVADWPVVRDLEVGLQVLGDVRFIGLSRVMSRPQTGLFGGGAYLAWSL